MEKISVILFKIVLEFIPLYLYLKFLFLTQLIDDGNNFSTGDFSNMVLLFFDFCVSYHSVAEVFFFVFYPLLRVFNCYK